MWRTLGLTVASVDFDSLVDVWQRTPLLAFVSVRSMYISLFFIGFLFSRAVLKIREIHTHSDHLFLDLFYQIFFNRIK